MSQPLTRIDRARIMRQLEQMRADLDAKLAEADATIASLRAVADTAGNAIVTSATDRQNLHQQVDGLTATMPAFGAASTPALSLLGSSRDVIVALNRPMPSASYTVAPQLAAALLGKATATVKSQTATTITLTVTSVVASVAASTVTVIAWP